MKLREGLQNNLHKKYFIVLLTNLLPNLLLEMLSVDIIVLNGKTSLKKKKKLKKILKKFFSRIKYIV